MTQPSILFATDFSNRDTAAFKTACNLALKSKSNLQILHVKDPRELAMAASKKMDPNVEFARYVPEDVGISFDHVLKSGEPHVHILQLANEKNANMIILGTHGRQGMTRVFQGSVAEKVMRGSDIPVLTVRDSVTKLTTHSKPQILVPIDFSVYGYAALDFATKLALSIGADLTIVYVDETDTSASRKFPHERPEGGKHQKEIWEQLKEYAPNSEKVEFAHKLLKGNPGSEICDYANVHHSDFIILGTHGRTGLGRVLMGSVAEHVVRNANHPVITVKPSTMQTRGTT